MPELLSPAGNFEKMRFALHYGADAVYAGARQFSLREGADNFSVEELAQAAAYAHQLDKKIYLTLNIYLHNRHWNPFQDFLAGIASIPLDGYIMSDLGAISYVREKYPHVPVHVSTQANVTNYQTVRFFETLGVKRIILARELSLEEIRRIRESTSVELETFVHGAMCIAYSGRCLLSNYFTNPAVYPPGEIPGNMKKSGSRDANLGDCSQSCRWSYHLTETTRPDEHLPVVEEEHGTTILSSRDLNLAGQLAQLAETGIDSFKIEGRMKSSYYVANVTRVYRAAIDTYRQGLPPDKDFLDELNNVSHRAYTTGFYFDRNLCSEEPPLSPTQGAAYIREYRFLGTVLEPPVPLPQGDYLVRAANQIRSDWPLEAISPHTRSIPLKDYTLYRDNRITEVVQPNEEFILRCREKLQPMDLIRRKEP